MWNRLTETNAKTGRLSGQSRGPIVKGFIFLSLSFMIMGWHMWKFVINTYAIELPGMLRSVKIVKERRQ